MGIKVVLNPFTGTLSAVPSVETKSISIELLTNDDSEFSPAIEAMEYNQKVFKFSQGLEHTLRGRVKVPSDYVIGKLRMSFTCYTPSTTYTYQFSSRSFLYQTSGVGEVGSESDYHDANSGVITTPGLANALQTLYLDLTDDSSKINGIPIAAGDLIDFRITRDTLLISDDTNEIRLIPKLEIIRS